MVFVLDVFGSTGTVFAQGSPPPEYYGLHIGPPTPVSGNEVALKANGTFYGPPVGVWTQAVSVNGSFVDLVVHLDHGSTFATPQDVTVRVRIPSLPPGAYTARWYTYHRYPGNANFVGPHLADQMTFTVVAPATVARAVEFYNVSRDHYFLATNADEIAALDDGSTPGWNRTGESLSVRTSSPGTADSPLVPACRFYGLPSAGIDSHFFLAFAAECAAVASNWPDAWLLETPNAFHAFLPGRENADIPSSDNGACPQGTVPVYRLYNNRPDANHRYTTSASIREQMLARGWMPEGLGALSVAMCTDAL